MRLHVVYTFPGYHNIRHRNLEDDNNGPHGSNAQRQMECDRQLVRRHHEYHHHVRRVHKRAHGVGRAVVGVCGAQAKQCAARSPNLVLD